MNNENASSGEVRLAERIRGLKAPLRDFFESKLYPPLVALLVLIGHISGTEVYLAIPLILCACTSLVICEGIRPLLPVLLTFVYFVPLEHVSADHTQGVAANANYYFSGARFVIVVLLALMVVAALVYRFVRFCAPKMTLRTPMLLPSAALCLSLMLGGAFSSEWRVQNLVFAFAQTLILLFLFLILYFGLCGEERSSLMDYICYTAVWVALVLILQMAYMYISYDNIIVDGSIVKEAINLGWGIWNPIGHQITVLIPFLVWGAVKCRYPFVYLGTALLAYAAAMLTLSRNALIFATLALAASVIIGCFFGERKRMFRIICILGIAAAVLGVIIFREKIAQLFEKLLSQGFSNNGRFELWRIGLENFVSSPVFGKGVYGYGDTDVFVAVDFIPTMAHNTPIQMLSATGIVGFICYLCYRAATLIPLFRKPTVEKCVMFMPVLLTVGMSLIDNFFFSFYTLFLYTVMIAAVYATEPC